MRHRKGARTVWSDLLIETEDEDPGGRNRLLRWDLTVMEELGEVLGGLITRLAEVVLVVTVFEGRRSDSADRLQVGLEVGSRLWVSAPVVKARVVDRHCICIHGWKPPSPDGSPAFQPSFKLSFGATPYADGVVGDGSPDRIHLSPYWNQRTISFGVILSGAAPTSQFLISNIFANIRDRSA